MMNHVSGMTLVDIVFEHRNKLYGAYDLRQQYRRHTGRALFWGVLVYSLGLIAPTLYDRIRPEARQDIMVEVNMTEIPLAEKPEEPPIVTPPPREIPVEVPQTRYLPPEVLADAPEEVSVPTTEDLKDSTPSDKTVEGDPTAEFIEAPTETAGEAPREEKAIEVERKEETIFTVVEQAPQFPGGDAALVQFLQKNLRYPAQASRANISGRVYIQFVVNPDGSIVEASVLKGIGFGCDEEALRVVSQMPRWRPGKQAGRPVRVRFTLPIVFALE